MENQKQHRNRRDGNMYIMNMLCPILNIHFDWTDHVTNLNWNMAKVSMVKVNMVNVSMAKVHFGRIFFTLAVQSK
jgi:hypothetical protein